VVSRKYYVTLVTNDSHVTFLSKKLSTFLFKHFFKTFSCSNFFLLKIQNVFVFFLSKKLFRRISVFDRKKVNLIARKFREIFFERFLMKKFFCFLGKSLFFFNRQQQLLRSSYAELLQ
jgi:hypothetical protein